MENAEAGLLAMQSISFFHFCLILVLLYLIYMQDSMFIGLMGIMQILLAFVPTLLVYRYVVGEDYLGILNLIAVYIILGIGVDDIFVFADQFHHQREEKQFDLRMQKTYNLAGKAIFTTSCTTFISFISNAGSAFPAVATFGLFTCCDELFGSCHVLSSCYGCVPYAHSPSLVGPSVSPLLLQQDGPWYARRSRSWRRE